MKSLAIRARIRAIDEPVCFTYDAESHESIAFTSHASGHPLSRAHVFPSTAFYIKRASMISLLDSMQLSFVSTTLYITVHGMTATSECSDVGLHRDLVFSSRLQCKQEI